MAFGVSGKRDGGSCLHGVETAATVIALLLSAVVAVSAVDVAPALEPVPATAPKTPALHEIAHVKALTPYCAAFEKHFNAAARPMLGADANVGYIDYTMGGIESHFHARAGETAVYGDRVHLIAYVGTMQKLLPQAQNEIDALRDSAKLATDPADAADTTKLASDLQAALDKQHQIALDSLSVVQALTDYTLNSPRISFEDLGESLGGGPAGAIALLSRPDPMGFLPAEHGESLRASPELQSGLPGGYDDYTVRTPAERRDVRSYLHYQNQVDRIGDAETAAALKADAIADRCR